MVYAGLIPDSSDLWHPLKLSAEVGEGFVLPDRPWINWWLSSLSDLHDELMPIRLPKRVCI
jgi:hypothetical protein